MAQKKACPHCGGELVAGFSNRYLLRCANKECARYVLAE